MPAPDTFRRVYPQATGGARPTTPPGMGGTVAGQPHARAAAQALTAGRQAPDVDERKSAALGRWWAERFARKVTLRGTGLALASGFAWASVPGPSDGFTWALRRVNVGPVDYTALPYASNVTVLLAVTGQQSPAAGTLTADVIASTTTAWPAEATWGGGELTLEGGDYLWVGVAGLTAGAGFTIGGEARETAAGVPEVYGI